MNTISCAVVVCISELQKKSRINLHIGRISEYILIATRDRPIRPNPDHLMRTYRVLVTDDVDPDAPAGGDGAIEPSLRLSPLASQEIRSVLVVNFADSETHDGATGDVT